MIIAVASDHAGYQAKKHIIDLLKQLSIEIKDFGCFSDESVDYPHFGAVLAGAVANGQYQRGILICGTGIGMSIVANKFPGVRAALCHDEFTAKACREHNDANILVMGARVLDEQQMEQITKIWLDTPFAGGRHENRLKLITGIEKQIKNNY